MNRRNVISGLVGGAAMAAMAAVAAPPPSTESRAAARSPDEPFGYCINTATLRGHEIPLLEKVEIAARAGYDSLELWIDELQKHEDAGGSLKDLGARITDLGMTVEGGIGFSEWIVDDDDRRRRGLEDARRSMELLRKVGGKRLAAPPAGATDATNLDLRRIAERYRGLLELGASIGVGAQVELWGFSKPLSHLSEVAYVAIESGHPGACVLADVYHLYKGGSQIEGLSLLNGGAMHVLHMNDYPNAPRNEITDAQRVFPGDGVAPLKQILQSLRGIGFRGVLSLELFNRDYWKEPPQLVARVGIEKMRAAVQKAFA